MWMNVPKNHITVQIWMEVVAYKTRPYYVSGKQMTP
jgi:hypothetical protein